jgi:hypothetical protein
MNLSIKLTSQHVQVVTMETILHFRRALEFIGGDYPFSRAFGTVRTRNDCVSSAQILFERLMGDTPGPFLGFDTLCLIARNGNGEIDRVAVKEMIRIFRPNRNGQLSKLDFVKSVDRYEKHDEKHVVLTGLSPTLHGLSRRPTQCL